MMLDLINNVPACETLSNITNSSKSRKLLVNFPVEDNGKCYGYIEILITCAVGINNNKEIIIASPCMVIQTMDHSEKVDTYIKRGYIVAMDKFESEGSLSEQKICLGSELEKRQLLVKLTLHKFIAWSHQVDTVINSKTVYHKPLQSINRILEIVKVVVCMGYHFMNNIRATEIKPENIHHDVHTPK